jgi:asparagine synthase (glutamine-hydrolysing)
MCGIAGYLHFDPARPASKERIQRMTDLVAHRGPDGQGIWIDGPLAFGHRRLAIIDLSTGDQPMSSTDGRAVIVYNGEIYNYLELRSELEKLGHAFRTHSDTEVILEAYLEWGDDCVSRFNGMWAFALWDTGRKRLFCSRDRAGEKPLFYTVNEDSFVFGSEIKTLFAYGLPKRPDLSTLDAYLAFTYIPAPHTFYRDVKKLPPGCSLAVEAGRVHVHAYWDLPHPSTAEERLDEDRICEEFESLFDDSVRLRMRSDVPVGAFLSGGLDSSSVVSAMSKATPRSVETFTIGFQEPEFDERHLARLVADRFRTEHHERVVEKGAAEELIKKIAWHYDEPFGDSSSLPTMIVSRMARERVTVALTGDGGDEVLSGYTIHQGEKLSRGYSALPLPLRRDLIPRVLSAVETLAPGPHRAKVQRIERVLSAANLPFIERLERKQSGLSPEDRASLLVRRPDTKPAREWILDALKPVDGGDEFARLNYWLIKISLADDMLCKVDRASMASALETRVPFLDHRLIELLCRVSMSVKLKGFTRKHVLRKTIGRRLPRSLLHQTKKGFGIPLRVWLRGETDGFLAARARRSAEAGLIDERTLETRIEEHQRGQRDASVILWTTAMLSYAIE